MKYAFIMNSGALSPESYSKLYEDRKNRYYFAATHNMQMTKELAKKLADEGFDFIDLCGDFDAEKAEDVRKASDGKIQVGYAKYSEEEMAKFNALPAHNRYGIIVLGFDAGEEVVRLELSSSEFNTDIAIVDTEETAAREAIKMVGEGIQFFELCGYFDAERAEKIRKAADYKAPVGYCGK